MIIKPSPTERIKEVIDSSVDRYNFNFIKDLKNLQKNFNKFKAKDFSKLIDTLIKKYESIEAAESARIRTALITKANSGDTKAIEIYNTLQKDNESVAEEVIIIDSI